MKNSFFLFILLFAIKITVAQSYVKFNPVRSLFGEASVFYEQILTEKSSVEINVGYIYKNKIANISSALTSRYGYISFIEGLCTGFLGGVAYRKYFGRNTNLFLHLGMIAKYKEIKNQEILFDEFSGQRYTANIDANRFSIQPQLLFGYRNNNSNKDFLISPYFGFSLCYRYGKITEINSIHYNPSWSFDEMLKYSPQKYSS